MAIATTLNSTYAARATPILKAAEDGWFPEIFKKCNKKQVPYVIMFFIYLIAVVPILFDLSIQVITNNIVVFTNLIMMLSSIAIIRLPTLYPKEWRKSFLHIPDVLFYIVMFLAFIAQSYLVYLSLLSFSVTMAIINLSFVAICVLFALWRYYSGKVNIKEKITFE